MKPTWLIESGVYRDHAANFKTEVERQGMICAEVEYQPGKQPPGDIRGVPPLPDDACVVLWGTLPLMRQIQLQRNWTPGGWCNLNNLECRSYYSYFGAWLLNDYYTMLPGVEALRLQEQLFAEFGVEDEVFIRPSGVHKIFTGRGVHHDDFRDALAPSRYDPTTLIVVSTPKAIAREWRLVIAGNAIVASSQYRDSGAIAVSRGCPDEVRRFVSDVLHHVGWQPDPVFMMDICESGDQLYVLELNSFSCSGLYDCDLTDTVRAVSAIAENRWIARRQTSGAELVNRTGV